MTFLIAPPLDVPVQKQTPFGAFYPAWKAVDWNLQRVDLRQPRRKSQEKASFL